MLKLSGRMVTLRVSWPKPMARTRTEYAPGPRPVAVNDPSGPGSAPVTNTESRARRTVMDPVVTGRWDSESTILPRITPGGACGGPPGPPGPACPSIVVAANSDRIESDSALRNDMGSSGATSGARKPHATVRPHTAEEGCRVQRKPCSYAILTHS